MTIQYEVITQKSQADGLILECWDVPDVVYPIIDIVGIPQEAIKVDLGIMEGKVEDFMHITATLSAFNVRRADGRRIC